MNEYAIISIDESRADKKQWIKQRFIRWTMADINFVDGRNPVELAKAKNKWNSILTPGPFKSGEFGIFYSVLNCLEYGAENDGILYFEDDAIPTSGFEYDLENYVNRLPKDADLFACWSPDNQQGDYTGISGFNSSGEPEYKKHYGSIFEYGDPEISKIWQGYGNVSMLFTKQGCIKMLEHVEYRGFYSPIDCMICIACHTGELNGYALKPKVRKIVGYDWKSPTTIHNTKYGNIKELIK